MTPGPDEALALRHSHANSLQRRLCIGQKKKLKARSSTGGFRTARNDACNKDGCLVDRFRQCGNQFYVRHQYKLTGLGKAKFRLAVGKELINCCHSICGPQAENAAKLLACRPLNSCCVNQHRMQRRLRHRFDDAGRNQALASPLSLFAIEKWGFMAIGGFAQYTFILTCWLPDRPATSYATIYTRWRNAAGPWLGHSVLKTLPDPAHWKFRAQRCRSLAEQFQSRVCCEHLYRLAATYDALAGYARKQCLARGEHAE